MDSSANVLTWLSAKEFQNHRQEWFYGKAVPVITEFDRLPAFQLSKEKNGLNVSQLLLISFDESASTDILSNAQFGGIDLLETDDFEIISYPDTVALSISGLEVGLYFLQMSDGSNTWYSEVFQFCKNVYDFIEIEYWHREIFCHNEGEFLFEFPYKNRVYINSDIAKPRYPYEESVKKNNGFNQPLQQISYKQYQFRAILPESQIDALRLIGLHDDVEISYKGRRYVVNEFLMTDPEWGDRGDVADVIFEFRTNTVVSISGRAVDVQPYEAPAGSCVATVHVCLAVIVDGSDEYNNFEYTNAAGQTVSLQDGDKVLVSAAGGVLRVYSYASSVYTLESTAAQTVVYGTVPDLYYVGIGSDIVLPPQIQFYDTGSEMLSGTFLPGGMHNIYQVNGGDQSFVGSYTYQQLAIDGVVVPIPDGTEFIRMEIASAACGIFQQTTDYELQTQGGPDQGIGNDEIGVAPIGSN